MQELDVYKQGLLTQIQNLVEGNKLQLKNFDSFGLKLFDRIIEEGYEESPKEGKHEERKVGSFGSSLGS